MVEQCKRRSSRLKGVAASEGRAVKAVAKAVKMGCEISSERPVEAEVKIQITGSTIEVKKFVTTSTDSCQDNCDICVEAEAKLAQARRTRRRREYRARRKQRQRAEKAARRDLQRGSLNNQTAGPMGSSLGGSIEGISDAMGSSLGGSTEGNSDATQQSVANYISRRNLPPNIIEIITIEDSSESEADEMAKLTRKYKNYN